MTANNVIRGPWVGNDPTQALVANVSLATAGVNQIKANHINDTLLALIPMLFHNIELAGFHTSDAAVDDTHKDGTLVIEAVKSMLFKHYDMFHPLQEVAENLFVQADETRPDALEYVDRLEMDVEKPTDLVIVCEVDEDDEDALEE